MDTQQTPILRQALGALIGVAVAVGLYALIQYASSLRVGGILIQPSSPISTSDQVRVNDRATDPAVVRRLAERARMVSERLRQEAEGTIATADTQTASGRSDDASSGAPAETTLASREKQWRQYDAITRSQRVVSDRRETRADAVYRQRLVRAARAQREGIAAAEGPSHTGAPLAQSGLGLDLAILASLILAGALSPALRGRFVAFLTPRHVD